MAEAKTQWYRPRDIARLRLITNSVNSDSENSNRHFILKLIKSGKLKAKNYGSNPDHPYYLVSADEIDRYHREES